MQSQVLCFQFCLIFSQLSTSLQLYQDSGLNNALLPKARYPFNHIQDPVRGGYEPHVSGRIGSPFIQTEITSTVDVIDGMSNNAFLRRLISTSSYKSDPYHTEFPDALSFPTPNAEPHIERSVSGAERSIANLGFTNMNGLQGVDLNQIATGVVEISSHSSGTQQKRAKKFSQSASSQFLDVLGQDGVLPEQIQNSKLPSSSRSFTVQSSPNGDAQRLSNQPQPEPFLPQHRVKRIPNRNLKPLAGLQIADQVFRIQNSGASNVASKPALPNASSAVLQPINHQGISVPGLSSQTVTAARNTVISPQPTRGHRHLSNNVPQAEVTNSKGQISPSSLPSPQSNIQNVSGKPKKNGQQSTNAWKSALPNIKMKQSTPTFPIVSRQQVTARNKNVLPKTKLTTSILQRQRATLQNVPQRLLRQQGNPSATASHLKKVKPADPVTKQTTGRLIKNIVGIESQRPNHNTEVPITQTRMNSMQTKFTGVQKPSTVSPTIPRKTQRTILNQVVNNLNVHQQPNRITETPTRKSQMQSKATIPKVSFNIPTEPQRKNLKQVVNSSRLQQTTWQSEKSRTSNSKTSGQPTTTRQHRPQPLKSSQNVQTRQSKIEALKNSGWGTLSRNVQKEPNRPMEPIQQVLRHPVQSSRGVGNRKPNAILRNKKSLPIHTPTAISGITSIKNLAKVLFGRAVTSASAQRSINSMGPRQGVKNNEAILLPPLPSRAVINPAIPSVSSAVIQTSNQPGISASKVSGLTSQTVSGAGSGLNTAPSTIANASSSAPAPTITNGMPSVGQNTASLKTAQPQGGQPSSNIGQNTVIVPSVTSNNQTTTPTSPTSPTSVTPTGQSPGTQNTLTQPLRGSQNILSGKASNAASVPSSVSRQIAPVITTAATFQTGSKLLGTQTLPIPNKTIPPAKSSPLAGVLTNTPQIGGLILNSASQITGPKNPKTTTIAAQTTSLNQKSTNTLSSVQNTSTMNVPVMGNSQIGSSVSNSFVPQPTANIPLSTVPLGVTSSAGTQGIRPQSVLDSINAMVNKLRTGTGNFGKLDAPLKGRSNTGQTGLNRIATGVTQPEFKGTPTTSGSLTSQTPPRMPPSSSPLNPVKKSTNQQKSKRTELRRNQHMSSQPFMSSSVSTPNQHRVSTPSTPHTRIKTTSGRQASRPPSNLGHNFSNNTPLQNNVVNYPSNSQTQTSPQKASLNNHSSTVSSHSKQVGSVRQGNIHVVASQNQILNPTLLSKNEKISPNIPAPITKSLIRTRPQHNTGFHSVTQTSIGKITNPISELPGRLRSDAYFSVEKGVVENKNLRSFLLQNIIDGPSTSIFNGVRLDGNQDQYYNPWSTNGMIDNSNERRRFRTTPQRSRAPGPRQQTTNQMNRPNHPESVNVVKFFNPLSPSIRNVRVTQAFF